MERYSILKLSLIELILNWVSGLIAFIVLGILLIGILSGVCRHVGIHPDGFLARGTASDPDIPKGVTGAKWYKVPGIWWNTVKRLSWTMVGKPAAHGCKFGLVHVVQQL